MSGKEEIVLANAEVELVGKSAEIIPPGYGKVPISELSSIGAAGETLTGFIKNGVKPGGEGIYKVTFPPGSERGTLLKYKTEDAYTATIRDHNGIHQARLKQVPFDPFQMFMAFTLLSMQKQLGEIQAMQAEILKFMEDKEETGIEAAFETLNDAVEEYQHNWNYKPFVEQKIRIAGSIIDTMRGSEKLYKRRIYECLNMRNMPHRISEANKRVNKLLRDIHNYHMAFYVRTYASYFEFILLGHFNADNIENKKQKFGRESNEYSGLINKCENWIKSYLESSIGYHVAPILKGFDGFYEKLLKDVPFDFDKIYQDDGKKYVHVDDQLEELNRDVESGTLEFVDSINRIGLLHNTETVIYLDDTNAYISGATGKEQKED